jgi:hypothetical protein
MKFRIIVYWVNSLLLFTFLICQAPAQENESADAASLQTTSTPKLYLRYERPTSLFRVGEDLTAGGNSEKTVLKHTKIGIRVCSTEPLLFSIARSTMNALRMADYLITIGYKKSDVFLLRASDCIGKVKGELFSTEIWGLPDNSRLPGNVENITYDELAMKTLGFDPVDCPKVIYRLSETKLIEELNRDKGAVAVIVGYYIERPSKLLKSHIKQIQKKLDTEHISRSRYRIGFEAWHDGDSGCISSEPIHPIILILRRKQK